MNFVKLTNLDNSVIFVNLYNVAFIEKQKVGCTRVFVPTISEDNSILYLEVRESPEEILEKGE